MKKQYINPNFELIRAVDVIVMSVGDESIEQNTITGNVRNWFD